MVKTVYRAKDGTEFDEEKFAHQHEAFVANSFHLKNKLECLAASDDDLAGDLEAGTVAFIQRNAVAIYGILQDMSKKPHEDDEDEDEPGRVYTKRGRLR